MYECEYIMLLLFTRIEMSLTIKTIKAATELFFVEPLFLDLIF